MSTEIVYISYSWTSLLLYFSTSETKTVFTLHVPIQTKLSDKYEVQQISRFSKLMLQPNFIEIYYDIHYFDAQNSVHQKQMYYGGF